MTSHKKSHAEPAKTQRGRGEGTKAKSRDLTLTHQRAQRGSKEEGKLEERNPTQPGTKADCEVLSGSSGVHSVHSVHQVHQKPYGDSTSTP